MEAKSIKEIKELIEGIEKLALAVKAVVKDGKVDMNDLPVLIGLLSNHQALVEAVKGAGDIPAEAKDLNMAEISEIVNAVLKAAKAIKEA